MRESEKMSISDFVIKKNVEIQTIKFSLIDDIFKSHLCLKFNPKERIGLDLKLILWDRKPE